MRQEIHERAFKLALTVATLRTDVVFRTTVKDLVLRQLARSCFSIAANLEESLGAYSRADFAAKVAISAKEGRELTFWVRLGREAGVLTAGGRSAPDPRGTRSVGRCLHHRSSSANESGDTHD